MWLTRIERLVLTIVGLVAFTGLSVLLWQRQAMPLKIAEATASTQMATWDEMLAEAHRVNVNDADIAELERLPEVGPGLARRIVQYREEHGPFQSSEELTRVQGIGPKTYEALREYIDTGPDFSR